MFKDPSGMLVESLWKMTSHFFCLLFLQESKMRASKYRWF